MAPTHKLSSPRPAIAVIGSLNVDLVTRTTRIPSGGETLSSSSFAIGFGGKGANQAVACARLSRNDPRSRGSAGEQDDTEALVDVRMYGAIGTDQFAAGFVDALRADGVDVTGVKRIEGQQTGVAVILVEESSGENRILVNSGANGVVRPDGLVNGWAGIGIALFQLEIPLDTVLALLREAATNNVETILNPAPAVPLPADIYPSITHLILNESEAAILASRPSTDIDTRQPSKLAAVFHAFLSKGVKAVVITLGSQGAVYQTHTGGGFQHVTVAKVKVVDTTAAGDTFAGAYAVAWVTSASEASFDERVKKAVERANLAAAITVQREGAQSAIPWLNEVRQSS